MWEVLIANADVDVDADINAQPSLNEASKAKDAIRPLFGLYEASKVNEVEVGDVLLQLSNNNSYIKAARKASKVVDAANPLFNSYKASEVNKADEVEVEDRLL